MASIRWFALRGSRLGTMLLGGCLALALTAVPAAGEISSVDAYGGQAQVLGPPVHRHGAASGSTDTQGSRRAGGQGAGTSGSQAGVGSAGSSSGSAHATPGSSSGAPTTPSDSNSAPGSGAGAGGNDGSGAASHDGAAAGAAGTGGAPGTSGAGQSPPIAAANVADVSNGSLSLSALDVLMLVAVFVALAAVGVLIRRSSRQSE